MYEDEAPALSLLFRVRGRLCALPLAHVVETMRPLPIQAMAGAPPAVRGLAIIRGAPVPVVEVAELLAGEGLEVRATPSDAAARFVTVRAAERVIALAVDSVAGTKHLPPDSLRTLPPLLHDGETSVVGSIGTLDAELLLVLRSARLVPVDLNEAGASS